jgi:hypothetical protein
VNFSRIAAVSDWLARGSFSLMDGARLDNRSASRFRPCWSTLRNGRSRLNFVIAKQIASTAAATRTQPDLKRRIAVPTRGKGIDPMIQIVNISAKVDQRLTACSVPELNGELVDLGGEDEIVFRQAADRMGPQDDLEVTVSFEIEVGVMSFFFS